MRFSGLALGYFVLVLFAFLVLDLVSSIRLAIDMKEGRRPNLNKSRCPGRRRRAWVDQVRDDAGISLSTLWSTEVARGHGVTRWCSTMRQ